MAGWVSL